MELTREYFDERIEKLATKDNVREEISDVRQEISDVRQEISGLESRIDGKFDALGRMVNAGFEASDARFVEVTTMFDVRERLEKTERDVQEIRRALKLA